VTDGVRIEVVLSTEATEAIISEITQRVLDAVGQPRPESPYLTIPEAATYLRCTRQRIDDLLSSGRLTRRKDGSRTLVLLAEIEHHLTRQPRRSP
jgi:excisionase family DNA binding protein